MRKLTLAAAATVALALACSNVDERPDITNGRNTGYFPNGDGSTWTYDYQRYLNHVPYGESFEFTETFDGKAVVGPGLSQRLVRFAEGEDEYELLFLYDDDEDVVRTVAREFYAGGFLIGGVYLEPMWAYLLYPLQVNRSWSEAKQTGLSPLCLGLPVDMDNDGNNDTVDVEIVRHVVTKEDLTLPMGTFEDCYKIRRTLYVTFLMTQGGDVEVDYVQYGWFKPQKGFVQYTGDEIAVPNETRYTFLAQLNSYHVVEPDGPR
jgi:hypothetical protein